jgi:hypothetical protein
MPSQGPSKKSVLFSKISLSTSYGTPMGAKERTASTQKTLICHILNDHCTSCILAPESLENEQQESTTCPVRERSPVVLCPRGPHSHLETNISPPALKCRVPAIQLAQPHTVNFLTKAPR